MAIFPNKSYVAHYVLSFWKYSLHLSKYSVLYKIGRQIKQYGICNIEKVKHAMKNKINTKRTKYSFIEYSNIPNWIHKMNKKRICNWNQSLFVKM